MCANIPGGSDRLQGRQQQVVVSRSDGRGSQHAAAGDRLLLYVSVCTYVCIFMGM